MRQRSPDIWARVRTINWLLGGVGMASALVCFLIDGTYEVRDYSRRLPRLPSYPSLPSGSLENSTPGPTDAVLPAGDPLQRKVDYLAFTGDNRTLIGSSPTRRRHLNRRELHAWDVASGRTLWTRVLPGPTDIDSTLSALMPDRVSLVTVRSMPIWNSRVNKGDGGYRHSLHLELLDARTGRPRNQSDDSTRQEVPHPPVSVDVAPDGRSVAVACPDRVVVWQVREDAGNWKRSVLVRPAERRRLPVSRAQFTADGKHLVVLSKGAGDSFRRLPRADIWDAATGRRVRSVGERLSADWGGQPFNTLSGMVALSPNRRRLVTFSVKRHRFVLWDVGSGERLVESPTVELRPDNTYVDLKFVASRGMSRSDRGESVAATIFEGETRFPSKSIVYWDTPVNRIRSVSTEAWGPARTDAISNDGRLAATPAQGYEIYSAFLRDARTGAPVRTLEGAVGLRPFGVSGQGKENGG